MKHQDDFAANGMVSIWVGNFKTSAEFDAYMNLSRDFETDFGFEISDRDIREAEVESSPKTIEQLLCAFSDSKSFSAPAAEAARKLGIGHATTVIVFHFVRFDPSQVQTNPNARLTFIGAFPLL
jgi:hypothetical protein